LDGGAQCYGWMDAPRGAVGSKIIVSPRLDEQAFEFPRANVTFWGYQTSLGKTESCDLPRLQQSTAITNHE
jgi:hypothetical protein